MKGDNSMKAVVIGAIVAVLVIGAYVVGQGGLDVEQDGPAEQIGEALDKAADEIKEGAEAAGN